MTHVLYVMLCARARVHTPTGTSTHARSTHIRVRARETNSSAWESYKQQAIYIQKKEKKIDAE